MALKISVVIPFYQRESGILRRALHSILQQKLPEQVMVDVVVVDDGSPVAVAGEVEGLDFASPFALHVITQPNGGPAMARNTGLRAVCSQTNYIAFLDSDDTWLPEHLAQALAALGMGYDFYFTDNARDSHHESYFASCSSFLTQKLADKVGCDLIDLNADEMSTAILRDFVAQASTTVFRRDKAQDVFFDTSMKNAGEDIIFFMQLSSRMERICFSPKVMVHCGSGINMYFSNLGWETTGYLKRLIDGMRAHVLINQRFALSDVNRRWNNAYIAEHKRNLAFHFVRKILKHKKLPAEMCVLAKQDRMMWLWFPYYTLQVAVLWPLGRYHPQ